MLEIIQNFIIVFIEISTLLILWFNLIFKEKINIKINIFITFVGTSITVFASIVGISYITLIAYISVILSIKIFYKKSLGKAFLQFMICIITINILQLVTIKVVNLIGIKYIDTFIFNFAIAIIVLLFVILMCYFGFNIKNIKDFTLNNKIISCFAINLGVYVIITKLMWDYSKELILDNLLIFCLVSICIFIINMFLYSHIAKITEAKKLLEVKKQYEPILDDMIEEIRRKQHDFKNYLNAINGIINVADEKELKNQLKKYINNVNFYNKELEDIMHIDNIVVRAIVYNKFCEAERLNIRFIFNITNNLIENNLDDFQITDLLNNFINNAFEAVLSQEDKIVILNILSEENTTIIEVKNSGITIKPEEVTSIFKRGFSTKGEKRGYGLYNIKKIVESSGGKIQLPIDDNYTTFRILFKQTFRRLRFTNKTEAS